MTAYRTLIGFAVVLGAAGCTVTGTTGMEASSPPPVAVQEPELVAVDEPNDVWVVQDADAPTYYSNGSYWSFRGGTWYQSSAYNGGWVAIDIGTVPPVIVNRDHRHYVHYRGTPYMRHRRGPHWGYGGGPRDRDWDRHHHHRR